MLPCPMTEAAHRNFIGGSWRESGDARPNINPSDTSDVIGRYAQRLERPTPGYYMEPALFTDSAPGMRINQEEIFGPVATVMRVRGFDEALAVARFPSVFPPES
jgi:Aldehyde dehydrogenase family